MGLFDLFRRSQPQPQPEPPPKTPEQASSGFERDPARRFDAQRSQRLAELFAVPREQRDRDWRTQFWDAAWTAALVVPEPPVVVGPDGFPYARLGLPQAPSYEANSLLNMAAALVQQGVGAALFATPDGDMTAAEYVIPAGVLDSVLRYDNPEGEPAELAELEQGSPGSATATTLPAGERFLIATPSADYLPAYSAKSLDHHLREDWGLAEPRIALLVSHSLRPSRSLVIGQSRAELLARGATDEQIAGWMNRILWFLPPSRSLMLMPDDWTLADMTPIRALI